jgi:phosphoglycerate dehydrogenase-like enzyme
MSGGDVAGDGKITVGLIGANVCAARATIEAHAGGLAEFLTAPDAADQARVREVLARAEAVVGQMPKEPYDAPLLRLVHATGAGVEHYRRDLFPPGVVLCNAYEHGPGIAEHVVAMLLMLRRDIPTFDRDLRAGRWNRHRSGPEGFYAELRGSTMAILGFGAIGRALVPIASALGMSVQVIRSRRPEGAPPEGVAFAGGPEDLDRVLDASDVLVVAVPLDEITRGMIGRRELALLGPEGILINVARGPVVDEDALYEALVDGTIAGAGIDVWYRYPQGDEECMPADRPFHELANVVMTPHTSGWTQQTARGRWAFIGGNLARLARGETPLNIVPDASQE